MSLGHSELDRWLGTADRLVVRCNWKSLLSDRFQPTSFPNLGAAEYGPAGYRTVVVDSPQSMANRLEALSWDEAARAPVGPGRGLPYVEVRARRTGEYLTSSRTEAHRLNGAWLRDSQTQDGANWVDYLNGAFHLSETYPMDLRHIHRTVYTLDPLCLIHGVFFSEKKMWGQPKIPRALTATMDAHGVHPVTSGGVKKDPVGAPNELTGGSGEGYGSIPYARVEYTADRIESLFVLDVAQIRDYGLDAENTELLFLLAVWEIAAYCAGPRRHRTFCDLAPETPVLEGVEGSLPNPATLAELIGDRLTQAPAQPMILLHDRTEKASRGGRAPSGPVGETH